MNAIILAAGRGSRMNVLTEDRPKCLVELWGKPLLEWQLAAMHEAGIGDVALVTGYKKEMLSKFGLKEFNNSRWSVTNMVSSLECADEWLKTAPCIVSYSDIYYEASAVVSLMKCSANLAVTYDTNWLSLWEKRFGDPLIDSETFRLGQDGTLKEIGKKPKSLKEIQGQYMGLLRFTPEGWSELVRIRSELTLEERDKMHMTGTLQRVIDAGRESIAAVPYGNKWAEVDSAEDLNAYSGASN